MKSPRNPPPATRNHQTWSKTGLLRWVVVLATLIGGGGALQADELDIKVLGLKEPLRTSAINRVETFQVSGKTHLSERRLRRIVENAERAAARALRPHGYYHATVRGELKVKGEAAWLLELSITPGPAVKIVSATIEVAGPGQHLSGLQAWKADWPLGSGKILDQPLWEAQKQAALNLAEASGYLLAKFTEHTIEADLEQNQATLRLVLDTGSQAVMGAIIYQQDILKPGIIEQLPRFDQGQAYDAWLLEKFRLDIWRTGYFSNVDVIEERRLEQTPPRVDLKVITEPRPRNTYQGSIGYGTDTLVRTQVLWDRHLLSSRGDSLNTGLGWQQHNQEYAFRSSYRLPRRVKAREFWTADLQIRRENQDLEVKPDDSTNDFIRLTNGDVIDYSLKMGKLIVRDRATGYQQIYENWFGQYVLERSTFSLRDLSGADLSLPPTEGDLDRFQDTGGSFSVGVNWDWPAISGSAFDMTGHHERAWIFTANKIWGSNKTFTQAYVSSNWHRRLGERWKILLRGEAGYSDADVTDLLIDADGVPLNVSATDLPNLFRFKAGGSRSVRGYAFEALSNNGLGSNNILTASAEVEFTFRRNWSLATFVDAGNAFNDWDEIALRKGVGLGIRWYSIAGPVRVDIAQARDIVGHPWRLHFTMGTPLL